MVIRILTRLATDIASTAFWSAVDAVASVRERATSTPLIDELRTENRQLREQLDTARRLDTYTQRMQRRVVQS